MSERSGKKNRSVPGTPVATAKISYRLKSGFRITRSVLCEEKVNTIEGTQGSFKDSSTDFINIELSV
jgi:hypothetical protein